MTTKANGSTTANKENGLAYIQARLKAPKSQYNKFGGYRYRSCEDILEAVKPLLAESGCTLTISDDVMECGGRVYIRATATLITADGQEYETTAFAREAESRPGMDCAQITGASSSYARKYALNGLFCIDDTKDADYLNTTADYTKQAQQPAQPQQAAPQQPQRDIPALVAKCTSGTQLLTLYNQLTPAEQQAYKTLFSNRKKEIA